MKCVALKVFIRAREVQNRGSTTPVALSSAITIPKISKKNFLECQNRANHFYIPHIVGLLSCGAARKKANNQINAAIQFFN